MRNDNREYDYSQAGFFFRPEYDVIAEWIAPRARVIDLACGNGSLMRHLVETRRASVEGIECSPSGVAHCRQHGLLARQGEIDRRETYADYPDAAFDFAVCNVTLHMVMYPEILLQEMARIGRQLIVSFPNFGHLLNRLDLLSSGRMPRPQLFGYRWFETGQIHQLGLRDFAEFCRNRSFTVLREKHMGRPTVLAGVWPSLFSGPAIYLLEP